MLISFVSLGEAAETGAIAKEVFYDAEKVENKRFD